MQMIEWAEFKGSSLVSCVHALQVPNERRRGSRDEAEERKRRRGRRTRRASTKRPAEPRPPSPLPPAEEL